MFRFFFHKTPASKHMDEYIQDTPLYAFEDIEKMILVIE